MDDFFDMLDTPEPEAPLDATKLDKYYTPPDVVKFCCDRVVGIIGLDNISMFVEPSAGNGAFLSFLQGSGKPFICYDILPEHEQIQQADFLKLPLEYRPGLCILGNPPFGRGNSTAVSFYKKAVRIADYIGFILPISQFNNRTQLYEFDLLGSWDLGKAKYSGTELHCCFNLYRRPEAGLNIRPTVKENGYKVVELRRGNCQTILDGWIYGIGTFGAGGVGKEVTVPDTYVKECFIYCDTDKRNRILQICRNADWKGMVRSTSGNYNLPKCKIIEHINKELENGLR